MLFLSLQSAVAGKLQARKYFNTGPLVKIVEEDHEDLKTEIEKSVAKMSVLGVVTVADITSDDGENVECQVTVQLSDAVNLRKKVDRKRVLDCVVEVLGALKGWQPGDDWTPLKHTGSHYKGVLEMGCVVWEVTFTTRTYISVVSEEGDNQLCEVTFSTTPAPGGYMLTMACQTPKSRILWSVSGQTPVEYSAPVFVLNSDVVTAFASTDYGQSAPFTHGPVD